MSNELKSFKREFPTSINSQNRKSRSSRNRLRRIKQLKHIRRSCLTVPIQSEHERRKKRYETCSNDFSVPKVYRLWRIVHFGSSVIIFSYLYSLTLCLISSFYTLLWRLLWKFSAKIFLHSKRTGNKILYRFWSESVISIPIWLKITRKKQRFLYWNLNLSISTT